MEGTFIKLDRSLLRHRYFDNVNVLKVWLWCLMKASHSPHKQLVGLKTVELKQGQFVTGRDAAARDLGMPGSTVWTILKLFEKDRKLDIKSNNKFSVISVIDYGIYQVEKYKVRQQNGQHPDSNLTANGQQPDTNKNVKNVKKGKNEEEKPLLRVSDVASLYQKYAGVNVVNGGQVVVFQDFIKRFTPETIEDAFAAAASAGVSTAAFLNWCKTRMERQKDAPQEAPLEERFARLAALTEEAKNGSSKAV